MEDILRKKGLYLYFLIRRINFIDTHNMVACFLVMNKLKLCIAVLKHKRSLLAQEDLWLKL